MKSARTSTTHRFPWTQLREGQGFFIPCLDLDAMKRRGFTEALRAGVRDPVARYGIKGGAIGVLFSRRTDAPVRSARRAEP